MKCSWCTDKRARRLAFLAGNATAFAALLLVFLMPIRDFFVDRDAHIAEQRLLLARLEAIVAQNANVQSTQRQLGTEMQGGEFLPGVNEGAINADLQTRLKGFTEGAGARLRSMQGLPPKSSDRIKYSGARVEIQGSMQTLQRAIFSIENAKPYLFVMNAEIKPALSAGNAAGVAQEPVIQAQLDVFAPISIEGQGP